MQKQKKIKHTERHQRNKKGITRKRKELTDDDKSTSARKNIKHKN
jgi:hypothetical protein